MFFLALALLFAPIHQADAFHIKEKLYIDPEAFKVNDREDSFYIHVGDNKWVVSDCIHRDATGLFAYEFNLHRLPNKAYEHKWKCPYCYRFWPIGTPCQNPDCPSKYK